MKFIWNYYKISEQNDILSFFSECFQVCCVNFLSGWPCFLTVFFFLTTQQRDEKRQGNAFETRQSRARCTNMFVLLLTTVQIELIYQIYK